MALPLPIPVKSSRNSNKNDDEQQQQLCILILEAYFVHVGHLEAAGNTMFKCVNCPKSSKPLSCSNTSRQNLKKHVEVFTTIN